jgi:putative tricarboxylic transport membrane protein
MDSTKQVQHSTPRCGSFGLALLVVSVLFLFFAQDIDRSSLTAENDPGPRAFPVTISLLLLAGGTGQLIADLRRRRRLDTPVATGHLENPAEASDRRGLVNVVVLISALLIFLLLVAWIGFLASTFLFSLGMTWWLGARWWHALVFAVVLVLAIDVLFVRMFEVALPTGLLGAVV